MPRRNTNATGKPQGVRKKKVQPTTTETPQYKTVQLALSIGSRLDPATVQQLQAVYR